MERRAMKLQGGLVGAVVCLGLACSQQGRISFQPTGLDLIFADAAVEFQVPVEVLKAVAWVETRWHMVEPAEADQNLGQLPAYGQSQYFGGVGTHHQLASARLGACYPPPRFEDEGFFKVHTSQQGGTVADFNSAEDDGAHGSHIGGIFYVGNIGDLGLQNSDCGIF